MIIRDATKLSLIVSGENRLARALYSMLGYQEIALRPLIVFPGGPHAGEWVLMIKDLN